MLINSIETFSNGCVSHYNTYIKFLNTQYLVIFYNKTCKSHHEKNVYRYFYIPIYEQDYRNDILYKTKLFLKTTLL